MSLTLARDAEVLGPLIDEVMELAARPEETAKKRMWAEHQALGNPGKIPVCVYYEGIPLPQWSLMWGEEWDLCADPLAKRIERDLRRTIWVARHVPDDHIVWPSIKVEIPPTVEQDWGLSTEMTGPDDPLQAKRVLAARADRIDLSLLSKPRIWYRREDIATTIERAMELVGGRLRIHPAYYATQYYAQFDIVARLRGMENALVDTIADPEGLLGLMEFITDVAVSMDREREQEGHLNVWLEDGGQWQQVGFRVHCAYMPPDFNPAKPRICDEWHYLSQQCSAGLGPDAFARFVFPFVVRLAEYMTNKTVYYHGCERLDEKMPILRELPNLRRFHVSPWSSVAKAAEVFGEDVILEVHDHPGEVFFGRSWENTRQNIRRLIREAAGHRIDINLSDIHSFGDDPGNLTRWAQIAQEEAANAL
ncbi:MAG: uroporphyrinogen decarboxylase family protein [Kiritimatiellae bacterium]|nr:uroporphyrinogen decarboxylase family protein [Kiritimatiellia bacterium]